MSTSKSSPRPEDSAPWLAAAQSVALDYNEAAERPLITLTTDFGTTDTYVGVMKGVMLRINPNALVVDLTHQVGPQNVAQGAFLLGTSYRYFPRWTIHVAVVDPGVGTSRRPLLLTTPLGAFVAPDNGLLSYVLRDGWRGRLPEPDQRSQVALPEGFRAYVLTRPQYWLHPVSQTFHGRDIFAPVAARLSLGVAPGDMGEETDRVACLPLASPQWLGDVLEGQVVHIDRFGNLVTNIPAELVAGQQVMVEVKGQVISGLSPSYAQGGEILAIVGSHGYLEIAAKNASARERLGAGMGERVGVQRAS